MSLPPCNVAWTWTQAATSVDFYFFSWVCQVSVFGFVLCPHKRRQLCKIFTARDLGGSECTVCILKYYALWRSHSNPWNTVLVMSLKRQMLSVSIPPSHEAPWKEIAIQILFWLSMKVGNLPIMHFIFGCLTGFIIMISTWVSVIVMLMTFVNGAKNGKCLVSQ